LLNLHPQKYIKVSSRRDGEIERTNKNPKKLLKERELEDEIDPPG